MAADVKSIAALADWKVDLVNFRTDGDESLSALNMEVQKAYSFLDDTEAKWKREMREAEEDLVQAKSELSRRELPDFSGKIPDTTIQKKAVQRCKARMEYCADQMDVCRRWRTRLPRMVSEEFEGPARRFENFLDGDLLRGISALDRQIDALEKYAAMGGVMPVAVETPKAEGT